jgi:predicted acylesterase/phospholipase RssA
MKALKKANLLHSVTEVIGVSGGALFALLFSLGYTLNEIERLSLQFDFTLLRNIDMELACMFPITFGLDTGENLEKLIHSILRQKGFSASTTFADLALSCPIQFRCYATEIQSSTIREFSAKATPTTSVLFAVRASMSLPFLYTPVKDPHSSDILMDGGILHNHPISFLTSAEAADTLSVQFIEDISYEPSQEDPGILDMFRYVYNGVIRLRANPYDTIYPENILSIPMGSAETAMSFEQSTEDKAAAIAIGEQKTTEFLQENHRPLPRRRFSAA